MAALTEQQKTEIVLAHARFVAPSDIVKMLREEFGVETDMAQVVRYNPTKPCYEGGERWLPVFETARKAYVEEVSAVPVAHQGYRLNLLQKGIDAAVKAKNWVLVARLAEQAAKEVGGVLTNDRSVSIDDNRRPNPKDMTPEDRRLAFAALIQDALDSRNPPGTHPAPSSAQ